MVHRRLHVVAAAGAAGTNTSILFIVFLFNSTVVSKHYQYFFNHYANNKHKPAAHSPT
jgi:hypothetical protein